MTSEKIAIVSGESRLLDALHAARMRRERARRREEQRKSHWLSSFSKIGLERHHPSEAESEG
jgi:hypothetical protein